MAQQISTLKPGRFSSQKEVFEFSLRALELQGRTMLEDNTVSSKDRFTFLRSRLAFRYMLLENNISE